MGLFDFFKKKKGYKNDVKGSSSRDDFLSTLEKQSEEKDKRRDVLVAGQRPEAEDFGYSLDNPILTYTVASILSDELNNDYTSRKDVLEKGVGDVDEKFAEELFRFALSIYSKVEGQIKPYISGKVMDDRKAKGVCPYCGGSYKGLFSKKCVLCGTGREK